MTAQQLKNSILQMAVQGKLVPQDPNDEPASVLLERIRAEKEQLIKQKKIKKEKNPSYIFRGADNTPYEKIGNNEPVSIADEVPFEIPDSWEWVRLGSISTYAETKQKVNAQNAAPSIWGLDLEDIEKGGRLISYKTVGERKAVGDKTVFSKGDILYSKLRPYLLKILVAPDDGICTPEIVPFRVYGEIDSEYIVYFLKSPYVDTLINTVTYGVKMPRVGTETMVSLFVPIPPIHEQYRIVEKLHELEPYMEQYATAYSENDALNAAFPAELKKSILQMAVQGKLVPQDPADEPANVLLERIRAEKQRLIAEGKIKRDKHESVIFRRDNSHYEKCGSEELCIDEEIPFDIPNSWVWCRLRTLLQQASTGPFGSMLHKNDYTLEGIPIINPADIKDGNISTAKIKKVSEKTALRLSSYLLHQGDVIIGRRGEMGRSATIDKHKEGWLCGTGCFYVTPLSVLSPDYLVFFLKSPYAKALLTENSVGTTMNNLNHTILGNMLIPLPPVAEQATIIAQYDIIQSIIDV